MSNNAYQDSINIISRITSSKQLVKLRLFLSNHLTHITILLGLCIYLHHKSITLNWIQTDDISILLQAYYYSPFQYYFNSDIYRLLTDANLTPWIILSFDIDIWLSGLTPRAFYIHHLASILILAAVTYGLISKYSDRNTAFLCTVLFVLMAPVATMPYYLPGRHYLEGLIFSALSIYFFLDSNSGGNPYPKNAFAALFYLLAITAKEVYVPVALLYIILSKGAVIDRLKLLLPYFIIVAAYIFWRKHMLGVTLGGYSHLSFTQDILYAIPAHLDNTLYIIKQLNHALFRSTITGYILLVLFILLLLNFLIRNVYATIPAATILVLLFGPIVPIAFVIKIWGIDNLLRYYFFIGWAFSVGLGVMIYHVKNAQLNLIIKALLLVLICAQLTPSIEYSDQYFTRKENKSDLLNAVMNYDTDTFLVTGNHPFIIKYIAASAHLKEITNPLSSPYVSNDPYIFAHKPDIKGTYYRKGFAFIEGPSSKTMTVDADFAPSIEIRDNAISYNTNINTEDEQFIIISDSKRAFSEKISHNEGEKSGLRHLFFLYNFHPPVDIRFLRISGDNRRLYSKPITIHSPIWIRP